jgi:hypothetical protein
MKKQLSGWQNAIKACSAVLASGILLTSCLKDRSVNNDNVNNTAAGLMAFNLATGQNGIGFRLSSNIITQSPLGYNNFTGVYIPVYPGSRTVEAFNYFNGNTLTTTSYNFEPTKFYSVFLVGKDSTVENVVVRDNFDSLATGSQAFVRYINAIPGSSGTTVKVTAGGTNVVNEAASYKNVSSFVPVDPGSVTVSVTNGSNVDATRTITLEKQKVYTILLIGVPGGTGDQAVQIKFVENGMVDNNGGSKSTVAGNKQSN